MITEELKNLSILFLHWYWLRQSRRHPSDDSNALGDTDIVTTRPTTPTTIPAAKSATKRSIARLTPPLILLSRSYPDESMKKRTERKTHLSIDEQDYILTRTTNAFYIPSHYVSLYFFWGEYKFIQQNIHQNKDVFHHCNHKVISTHPYVTLKRQRQRQRQWRCQWRRQCRRQCQRQ